MNATISLPAETLAADFLHTEQSLTDYLETLMAEYQNSGEQGLFLPSLVRLSNCFNCSPVEVHHALNLMKDQGYDFLIMGFESPITVWYPPKLGYLPGYGPQKGVA